jgi:hypothetical protein
MHTMQTDAPDQELLRSLAQDLALGGSATAWAGRKEICAELAVGWTELPEFREALDKCRLDHAERMVGKVASCVERAIDRLVEFSERSDNPSVGLAATKAIIDQWVALSVYFVQEHKYHTLTARLKFLLDAQKEAKKAREAWA